VGIEDWLAACRDDLVPGIPRGGWGDAHLANPPKSRGLRPCRGGDRVFACRSAFLLLGVANPPDAWTLGMAAGLVVRAAFLLLGVAFLLLGVGFLPDRWQLVGVPFLLIGVATLLGGVVALLDGWTLVGGRAAAQPGHGAAARGGVPAGQLGTAGVPFLLGAVATQTRHSEGGLRRLAV
jgi:hypothetical protein